MSACSARAATTFATANQAKAPETTRPRTARSLVRIGAGRAGPIVGIGRNLGIGRELRLGRPRGVGRD